jgi:hypothetical protein
MKINHNNATPDQIQYIESLIKRDISANQTLVVNELFAKEIISTDEIQNLYSDDDCDEFQEIFSWFLLADDYIADKLIELKEPVIKSEYGNWWGRTIFGQAIVLDSTFWNVYQDELNSLL